MGVPIAWLADRYSRRNIIAIGLAFWSVMTTATGLAANLWQLVVTRFLMGAGEAAGVSPANSMLSDLFDDLRRPLAVSVMTSGSTLGMVLAYLIGGWVDEGFGWRAVFFIGGLPGLIIALAFYLSVREPRRGAFEHQSTPKQVSPLGETLLFLARSRTYVIVLIGGSMMAVHIYATMTWAPAFMIRVHQLSPGLMGTYMALARGPTGLIGIILGGWVVTRLSQQDARWRVWLPALVCIVAAPLEIVFLFADNLWIALASLAVASLFSSMYTGPIFALLLGISRVRMRAMATAIFVVCGSFVGQCIGPLGVGYMNDLMRVRFGAEAIRYSLLSGPIFTILAGMTIWAAAGSLAADSRRAVES
jgi:predicted MFS family arabinose efflux permease